MEFSFSKEKKPKILLLSDDVNSPSGIGTMSRALSFFSSNKLQWVQLGAAINHHAYGQVFNMSDVVKEETGFENCYFMLYPYNSYGDQNALREILEIEKPDAILHFTDPRFWDWLYDMEYEIHTKYKIPIMYYAIWDNLPYPIWNDGAYSSCDLIMGISKQSHIIHNTVLKYAGRNTKDLTNNVTTGEDRQILTKYIPHGVNSDVFKPIENDNEFKEFKREFRENHNAHFIVLWNNRNIRRKNPADVILAFKLFVDKLPEKQKDKVALLLHTNPLDENGTDLVAVKDMIAPNCNVIISTKKVSPKQVNYLYNVADVTLNIASNEGFGLSSMESIMAGTMVINNVTGGLQDQMDFHNEEFEKFIPNEKEPTNHNKKYPLTGNWAIAVWPSNRSIQGSIPTPYIYDDRCQPSDVADAIFEVYNMKKDQRNQNGLEGRKWAIENGFDSKTMAQDIANTTIELLNNWKAPKRFWLDKVIENENKIETGI